MPLFVFQRAFHRQQRESSRDEGKKNSTAMKKINRDGEQMKFTMA